MTFFRTETRSDVVVSGFGGYNPFENPAVPLATVGLDNIWSSGNNNDSGQAVTPDTAAGVGTFYRCLSLLSSVVASCPLETYRKRNQELIDNDLFDPSNTDLTYTPFEYMQLVMVYRLVWGNAYVYKKRDTDGSIIDLKPLYPDLVQVGLVEGKKKFLVKHLRPDGTVDETVEPTQYSDREIMHIPGLGYDGLKGLPVTTLMAQSLGTAIAADRLAGKFYSQGTQLGGIIKVKAPLRSQTQAQGIKDRWQSKKAGVDHAAEVAILDAETDYQDMTIPPDKLQFLESRRWQTTEITRWFGIPPHLVGDVEKSTSWGSGIETQNIGLNTYTLNNHFNPIEQRHTREVIKTRGQFAKFNLNEMMRGSTQERYQALITATGGPFMSRAEARKSENMQPIEGHPEYDELLPPQGIGPMGPDGQPAPGPGGTQKPPAGGPQGSNSGSKTNVSQDAAASD